MGYRKLSMARRIIVSAYRDGLKPSATQTVFRRLAMAPCFRPDVQGSLSRFGSWHQNSRGSIPIVGPMRLARLPPAGILIQPKYTVLEISHPTRRWVRDNPAPIIAKATSLLYRLFPLPSLNSYSRNSASSSVNSVIVLGGARFFDEPLCVRLASNLCDLPLRSASSPSHASNIDHGSPRCRVQKA